MREDDPSDSDTQETESNSSSEELESPKNGGTKKMSVYEQQRAKRIEENRARMEALGLRKLACSVMDSVRMTKKKKGKAKRGEEDDEEYRPPEEGEDEGLSSSSGKDDETERPFWGRRSKPKKIGSTPKKKVVDQNLASNSSFVDDDDALFQAIALSLKGSTEFVGERSQSSNAHLSDCTINERKRNARIQEDTGKRKRKKTVTSRVKMTEDEFVIHFFHFDEAGKGGITLRDLKRVAAAHDFAWTNKEMTDMIYCFDSDGDGKLNLNDFRKIVGQCNMIEVSDTSATGSKA